MASAALPWMTWTNINPPGSEGRGAHRRRFEIARAVPPRSSCPSFAIGSQDRRHGPAASAIFVMLGRGLSIDETTSVAPLWAGWRDPQRVAPVGAGAPPDDPCPEHRSLRGGVVVEHLCHGGGPRRLRAGGGTSIMRRPMAGLPTPSSGRSCSACSRAWRPTAGNGAGVRRGGTSASCHTARAALSDDVESSIALLLWGIALALLTATMITSAVSLALGLVLMTLAATPLGVIVNFALIRLWRALAGVASRDTATDDHSIRRSVPHDGRGGPGSLLDWGADSRLFSLVVGILAGGGSLRSLGDAGDSTSWPVSTWWARRCCSASRRPDAPRRTTAAGASA